MIEQGMGRPSWRRSDFDDPDAIANDARDYYARWYVQEKLVGEAAQTVRAGVASVRSARIMGWPTLGEIWEWMTGSENLIDQLSTEENLDLIINMAEWLVAEAHWHRLHGEMVMIQVGLGSEVVAQ